MASTRYYLHVPQHISNRHGAFSDRVPPARLAETPVWLSAPPARPAPNWRSETASATCRPDASTQTPVAAKVTQLGCISEWARAQLSEEIAIWETLKHPHIVRMYGHLADATRHVLLLEHALGGELFEACGRTSNSGPSHWLPLLC